MLPEPARLRTRAEFGATVRGGTRAGRRRVVVHHAARPALDPTARAALDPSARAALDPSGRRTPRWGDGPRVGLVVSGGVGGSVVRKRVSRRLRHVMAPLLAELPGDVDLVVRALPASASASSAELRKDVVGALTSLGLRSGPPGRRDE